MIDLAPQDAQTAQAAAQIMQDTRYSMAIAE
jgi:hypothetical protein